MTHAPIIIPCATEEDWHAERAKAIGASECAALLGIHPYMTPLQLWSKKKLALPPTQVEGEQIEAGHFAELMCAPWYSKRTGRDVMLPQEFYEIYAGHDLSRRLRGCYAVIVRHPTLPIQCTPDRIAFKPTAEPGGLQLKNADRFLLDEWGDDETAKAPLAYQVQTLVEMMCCGFSWGSLAAVIGGYRLRYVDIERHAALEAQIGKLARVFWDSLSGDIGPAPSAGDLADVKRRFPESAPGLSCEYPHPEDIMTLARLKAEASLNDDMQDALLAKIQSVTGPAEVVTINGTKAATHKSTIRHEKAREARETTQRPFNIDRKLLEAAKAALITTSHHGQLPILPLP